MTMWRGISNVPRAIRCYWNSSVPKPPPQAICHEDDSCTDGLSRHRGVQTLVFIQGRKYYDYFNEERRQQHDERTTDCDWAEWIRSFRREFWSHTGAPCIVEAVGWGTVLLLGLQVSQYYKLWNAGHMRKYGHLPEQAGFGYHAQQLALALHMRGNKDLFTAVLPVQNADLSRESDSTEAIESVPRTEKKPKERDKDVPSLWQMLYACQDFESRLKQLKNDAEEDYYSYSRSVLDCDAALSDEELSNKDNNCRIDDELSEARGAWSELDKHYVNIACNVAAQQHAKGGDIKRAIELWQRSSMLGSSCFNLALCYELGRGVDVDLAKASVYYEVAVAHGHHKAMYNLARLYLQGDGVEKNLDKAVQLLQQAAEHGLAKAQCDLGAIYAKDDQNREKSCTLFELSANQKDMCGQYNLGQCYQLGSGVEQNLCKAAELYSDSARQGHAPAQYMMAMFFHNGLGGLPENSSIANEWRELADDQLVSKNSDGLVVPQPLVDHCSKLAESEPCLITPVGSTVYSDKTCDGVKNVMDTDDCSEEGQTEVNGLLGIPTQSKIQFYIPDSDSDLDDNVSFTDELFIGTGEGHFGESIPKIHLVGSFGNISFGQSAPRSKLKRQLHSDGDFGSYNFSSTASGGFRISSSAVFPGPTSDNDMTHSRVADLCSLGHLGSVLEQDYRVARQ